MENLIKDLKDCKYAQEIHLYFQDLIIRIRDQYKYTDNEIKAYLQGYMECFQVSNEEKQSLLKSFEKAVSDLYEAQRLFHKTLDTLNDNNSMIKQDITNFLERNK